jgi:vacuolar-type H+-ATPase subunit E/Vma4
VSIDSLLAMLDREGRSEAEALASAAQARAAEILAQAEADAERHRARELARLEEERRRAVASHTAAAERGHREALLQERARVLDRIFEAAERELGAAAPARYQLRLPGLVRETLRFLERGPAVLRCRPELAAEVERLLPESSNATVRAGAEAAAGITGESADGAVVVDNTLPALLRRRREELAIAVAARLLES